MAKKPSVSVIIPTYNRTESLIRTIKALSKQTSMDFEVIIIDDNSKTNPIELIKKLNKKWIKLIRNTNNKGPAFSRNIGIKKANGKYIGFIDDDVEPSKNWMKDLLTEIIDTDDKTAAICGLVYPPQKGNFLSKAIYYLPYMDENTSDMLESNEPMQVNNVSCTNSMWKKDVLKRLKGFRVDLIRGQDSELSYRAIKKGYKFTMFKKGAVIHHYRADLIDFLKTAYRSGKGSSLTELKHKGYLKGIRIPIYSFPILLLVSLFYPWILLLPIFMCRSGLKAYKYEKDIRLSVSVSLLQFVKSYLNLIGIWKVIITRKY